MIRFVYDLNIVLEAIENKDYKDAVAMIKEIQEDLKILELLQKKQLINLFINKKGFILQSLKKQKQ